VPVRDWCRGRDSSPRLLDWASAPSFSRFRISTWFLFTMFGIMSLAPKPG